MSWIEYQRSILADSVRNKAFEKALATAVRPGETTVVDIGSGTGFLSFLAARLGAKDVFAVEHNEQLQGLALELAGRNRIENVTFVGANSAEVDGLPPAELVVSETLGNYALEENILEILRDARRFLAPGGTLMPCAIEQYVAPVIEASYYDELASWDRIGYGMDYRDARALGFNNLYVRRFPAEDLSGAVRWDVIDLLGEYDSLREGRVAFTASEDQIIYGFANWWRAELVPGLWLSTAPHDAATHWEQIYFPVAQPVCMQAGDTVTLVIISDSRDGNGCSLAWTVTHTRGNEVVAMQSFDISNGS
jgi:SAM-dependent methyltransferase